MDADQGLEAVCALLDEYWSEPAAPPFVRALAQLAGLAELGNLDAAEHYAEVLAQAGPHFDPAAAYRWYFIALAQQGYSTNDIPRCGWRPSALPGPGRGLPQRVDGE